MDEKPEILDTRLVAKSRLFGIEELHLRFRNGVERTYERLRTPPIAAVMMVPLLDDDTVVMIREYGAGTESYELTLPKGAYEHGEDWRDAANRELKEEAGYGARRLTLMKDMTLSPGYMATASRWCWPKTCMKNPCPGTNRKNWKYSPGNCPTWIA